MVTPKIFPIYYHIDHRIIFIEVTCHFYKSPPYRDTADTPLTSTEFMTFTSPGLLNQSAPPLYTRLPHRPFIIIPNTVTAAHSPVFGLADTQIRRIAFPR
jgi:hypothetical protein